MYVCVYVSMYVRNTTQDCGKLCLTQPEVLHKPVPNNSCSPTIPMLYYDGSTNILYEYYGPADVTSCTMASGTFSKVAVFVFRVSTHRRQSRSQVHLTHSSSSTQLHLTDAPKEHNLPIDIEN